MILMEFMDSFDEILRYDAKIGQKTVEVPEERTRTSEYSSHAVTVKCLLNHLDGLNNQCLFSLDMVILELGVSNGRAVASEDCIFTQRGRQVHPENIKRNRTQEINK